MGGITTIYTTVQTPNLGVSIIPGASKIPGIPAIPGSAIAIVSLDINNDPI